MAKTKKKPLPDFIKNDEHLHQLATEFVMEVDQGDVAKGSIKDRWDRLEAIYRNEPKATGKSVLEDFPAEHIPLVQPKISRIIDSYIGAINASRHIVTAIPEDPNVNRKTCEHIEKGLNAIAEKAGILRTIRQVTQDAAVCGIGFLYAPFIPGEGFKLYSIHPNDIVITPTSYVGIHDAILVGPRYFRTISEIRAKQAAGEYFETDILAAGDSSDQYESGRNSDFDRTSAAVHSVTSDNDTDPRQVEVRLCWWFKDIDGKGSKWYQVLVAYHQRKMLDIAHWPYSRPPLFDQRAWDEPVKFWPATSIAQSLQGVQIKFTEAWNLWMAGNWYAAIPPVIITGGQLETGLTQFQVGGIYQQKQGNTIEATVLPCQFNGQYFAPMLQMLSEIADSISGISTNGNGQNLPQGTTATEAGILASSQDARLKAYVTQFSYTLESLYGYIYEVCQEHPESMRQAYGGILPDEFFSSLGIRIRFEVTGKNPANLPQQLIANAELLLGLAQNPESRIKFDVLTQMLVDASQINATEELFYTDEEMAQRDAQAQQMALMGGQVAG